MAQSGLVSKHASTVVASRAAERRPIAPGLQRRLLGLALGITATLVAWGVLVYAAIQFGQDARTGALAAWVFLVLSTLGAAACLFVTLMLGIRVADVLRHSPDQRAQLLAPRPRPRAPRAAGRRVAR